MKIYELRNLVNEYQKIALPIKQRKFIQKQLGKDAAAYVARQYDEFLKSDIVEHKPKYLMFNNLYGEEHVGARLKIKRAHSDVLLFAAITKENIIQVINGVKKLSKTPENKKFFDLSTLPAPHNWTIKQISREQMIKEVKPYGWTINQDDKTGKYFQILNPKGEQTAVFSTSDTTTEKSIGGFIVSEKVRKTDECLKAIQTMQEYFKQFKDKNLSCNVDINKPSLVRMYEKLGFRLDGIYSIKMPEQNDCSIFEMIKQAEAPVLQLKKVSC